MSRGAKVQQQQLSSELEDGLEIDEDLALVNCYFESQEDKHHKHILSNLAHNIQATKNGEQLTWTALYSLKKKQLDLNQELREQIELVKNKYQLLKQPLYKQISEVALGNKVLDTLYQPQGLSCQNRIRKMAPKKILNFWGIVFDKQDILTEQVDVECFDKIKNFDCEVMDLKTNHLHISFKFNAATEYFQNLQLTVDVWFDAQAGPVRKIKEQIKYKKEKIENSIFTLLFDSTTEVQVCYNFASEIYQDYSNALYFYFREDDLDSQTQNKSILQNTQNLQGQPIAKKGKQANRGETEHI